MSKLSELLNPAPSSTSQQSPTNPQFSLIKPLIIDGRDHRNSSSSHTSPSHKRLPSITSPGLEALADIASATAHIPSPTTHHHTNSFGSYQPNYERFGSGPAPSHTLPPLTDGLSNGTGLQQATYPSGLAYYHHRGSDEPKDEGVTGSATTLPPLQQSPKNKHYPSVFEQLSEASNYVNGEQQADLSHISGEEHGVDSTRDQDMPDAPAIIQIRQSSQELHLIPTNKLESQSEQVQVKAEVTDLPLPTSLNEERTKDEAGPITVQSFMTMGSPLPQNLDGVKKDVTSTSSQMSMENLATAPPSKPRPETTNKKRPAPASTNKKGTASTMKRSHKKRKIEPNGGENMPAVQRLGTPTTNRTSTTPLQNRRQASITPARSSSIGQGDDGESEDDNAIYCICRKPDDHNLMIGCDGPCGDWYHTKCVNMEAGKHKLISTWYCPLCAEKGYETLWKRMCRLEGCQEPARSEEPKSKYCSDEHGAAFMSRRAGGPTIERKKPDGPRSHKKKRQDNYTDNFGTMDGAHDDPITIRGGVVRADELKALTEGVTDVKSFHRLGDGVLSPPRTASPENASGKVDQGPDAPRERVSYTEEEKLQFEQIVQKRTHCRERKKMLDDRDRFIVSIVTRAKTVLTELKEKDKSIKDICGYDSRLSWSDEEFNDWRSSSAGKAALVKDGILYAPTPVENGRPKTEEDEGEVGKGVCKRKRCERHRAWLKLAQQDNLFEKDQARQEMKRLEAEEKQVKDRALIRSLEMSATVVNG